MKSALYNERISEEELEIQRKRTQLQDADRKSFYHTSSLAKQRNKEQIKQLQKENKELREQLQSRAVSIGADASDPRATDKLVAKTEKELALWRRKWDEVKASSKKRKNELLRLQDKLGELQGIGSDQVTITSDDNPQMRTIRMLENKLDKAMIKYNEAQSIRKTYEMIVKRLRDERVGYDNQLAAIEQSLNGKQHDYEELLLLSYDAKHAKEVAEAELRKFEAQLQAKRELRDKEIAEQQKAVKQRVESKTKNEERTKENHEQEMLNKKREHDQNREQKLTSQLIDQDAVDKRKSELEKYDQSLRKIKDATGASDINEIIQRCVTQKETLENLKKEREEFEKRILMLDDEKIELKKKLQRIKYEGIENVTRKQINELEKNVVDAQARYEKNKDKLERIVKKLVDSKAGIEHLSDKLIDIKLDDEPNITVTDDTLVESLMQIEKKWAKILDEVKSDDLYEEVIMRIRGLRVDKENETPLYKKLEYDVPSLEQIKNNVRVRIPEKEEDDLSDIDPDAEAEAEINERMKIKVEAQLRYDRMAKNKMRKAKKPGKG